MRKLRILDLDIENRPLSYLGQDFTTRDLTAIAWCWDGKPKSVECRLLGRDNMQVAFEEFRGFYDEADMVTGHYLRVHDLPVISGASRVSSRYPSNACWPSPRRARAGWCTRASA